MNKGLECTHEVKKNSKVFQSVGILFCILTMCQLSLGLSKWCLLVLSFAFLSSASDCVLGELSFVTWPILGIFPRVFSLPLGLYDHR